MNSIISKANRLIDLTQCANKVDALVSSACGMSSDELRKHTNVKASMMVRGVQGDDAKTKVDIDVSFSLPPIKIDGAPGVCNVANVVDGIAAAIQADIRNIIIRACDHAFKDMQGYVKNEKLLDAGKELSDYASSIMKGIR